jgi:SAM-dependent methyltransferase
MTQNIYDNEDFFQGYSGLRRSLEGLAGAAEWPSIAALLPAMSGLRVLDLGCGFGWFCRWARQTGAARVTGLDVSERMLARARIDTSDPAITYERADLEAVVLPESAFDLVYSSLALHYIVDLDRLIGQVAGALVAGGHFVFSVEHPIFTAPSHADWTVGEDGRKIWPVDSYLVEGPRTTDWLAKGVIKQHRALGTYINRLVGAGFAIAHVEEWGPSPEQIAVQPDLIDERQRPPFLLIVARRTP